MNIVKGVADLIRRTSGAQPEESGSWTPSEKFSVPSPRICFRPHIDLSKNLGKKQNDFIDANKSSHANVDMENFDDFGIDLYPAPETSLIDSDTDDDDNMNCTTSGKEQNAVPRCSETPIVRPQNLESSDLSQGITRACGFEGALESKLHPKLEEQKKLDGLVDASFPVMPKADLPSELRCSLCNTIFKEAVMKPCCQHSFCDKYGESGIQAKDFCCAVTIRQRDPVTPNSPTATGKGSNHVMTESAYDSMFRSNRPAAGTSSRTIHLDTGKRSATSSQKIDHMRNGERDAFTFPANFTSVAEGLRSGAGFEGENQSSNFHPSFLQDEVKEKEGALG